MIYCAFKLDSVQPEYKDGLQEFVSTCIPIANGKAQDLEVGEIVRIQSIIICRIHCLTGNRRSVWRRYIVVVVQQLRRYIA
jgi:hypothetical protein